MKTKLRYVINSSIFCMCNLCLLTTLVYHVSILVPAVKLLRKKIYRRATLCKEKKKKKSLIL